MSAAGNTVGSNVKSAVNSSLTSTTLRSAGVNAMAGLKAGINAGRSGVISAMRSAARAAVSAAKSELKIKSPSRVFEDEVGVMTMRGFGQGVLKESREQARVIRNASRYLTGEAKNSAIAYSSSDNRRTVSNQIFEASLACVRLYQGHGNRKYRRYSPVRRSHRWFHAVSVLNQVPDYMTKPGHG